METTIVYWDYIRDTGGVYYYNGESNGKQNGK